MTRVAAVFRKEISELWANPWLLLSLGTLPVVMVATTLFILGSYVGGADDPGVLAMARWYDPSAPPGPAGLRVLIEATVRNSLGLFLVMPMFLPVVLSSQAFAGEKERRTLEPLLATPLTAADLVLGKSLASVVPACAMTWGAFLAFAVGADVIVWPLWGRLVLPDATFLFAVFVLAPLLSFFGNCISVLISARVGEVRLAQTLAGLLVMPFFGLVSLQFGGLFTLGLAQYAALAAAALAGDLAMFALAVRLFDRDRLLTRWS